LNRCINKVNEGPERCGFFTIKIKMLLSPKPKKQKNRIQLSIHSENVTTLILKNVLSRDREHSMQCVQIE